MDDHHFKTAIAKLKLQRIARMNGRLKYGSRVRDQISEIGMDLLIYRLRSERENRDRY